MQNEFFKIRTDSDSPSEAEPSFPFSSKSVENAEVRGVLVLKISKSRFLTHCANKILKIAQILILHQNWLKNDKVIK